MNVADIAQRISNKKGLCKRDMGTIQVMWRFKAGASCWSLKDVFVVTASSPEEGFCRTTFGA